MRTRKSIFSFTSGLLATFASLAVGFLVTPFVLHRLGPERFGALRVGVDLLGYLALLELGLGGALSPLLAEAAARGDRLAEHRFVAAALRTYTGLAGLMAVAGLGLVLCIGFFVPLPHPLDEDLRRGAMLSLLGTLVLPTLAFRSLLEARQKGYVLNLLLTLQGFLVAGLSVLFAFAAPTITGQFAAILIGNLLLSFSLAWAGRRELAVPLGSFLRSKSDALTSRTLWRRNASTFLLNLCGRLSVLSDNLVVSAFLGAGRVAPFYLTQRVPMLVQSLAQGVGGASWAALVELEKQKQHDVFRARLLELTHLLASTGFVVLGLVAALNEPFIRLWIGPANFGGAALSLLATVNAFFLPVLSLWTWCVIGSGQVRRILPLAVGQAAVNVATSLIATAKFGLIGPLVGTLASHFAVSLWALPLLLQRLFGVPARNLLAAMVRPCWWGIPFGAAVYFITRDFPPTTWLQLIGTGAAWGCVGLVLWWLLGLNPDARRLWLIRARVLLGP